MNGGMFGIQSNASCDCEVTVSFFCLVGSEVAFEHGSYFSLGWAFYSGPGFTWSLLGFICLN